MPEPVDKEKATIVLADDNKEFCDFLAYYLEKHYDFEIVGMAYNGVEAYNMITEYKPDIAILDGVMPHLDGLGVLHELGQGQNPEHTPICIVISVITQDNIKRKAIELGADYYIEKPLGESFTSLLGQLATKKSR